MEGGTISSTLEAIRRDVMPTNWSLARDTIQAEGDQSCEKGFGHQVEAGMDLDEPVG